MEIFTENPNIVSYIPLLLLVTPCAGADVAIIVAAAEAAPLPIVPDMAWAVTVPTPPRPPLPAEAAACNFKPLGMLTVTLRPLLLITPFMGGDDEISDDDDETPLDEDGDGEGVEGVGEPRVMAVAEIFLAVNDRGTLLLLAPLARPKVSKALGLPIGGLPEAAVVLAAPLPLPVART